MGKKKNKNKLLKKMRQNYKHEQTSNESKEVKISEGQTLYISTRAHGGSEFVTPIKIQKSKEGKLFMLSPAYTSEETKLSVLEKSQLRRDDLEIEILIKRITSFVNGESNYTLCELTGYVDKIMSIDDSGTYLRNNRKSLAVTLEAEFFRVIPLLDDKGNLKTDFDPLTWRKISPYRSLQRLNTEDEAVIYTAMDGRVAMEEAGILTQSDKFAMFIYKPRTKFEVLPLQSNPFLNEKFPSQYREYGLQVTRMLNEVFSTNSTGNEELDKNIYKLSNYIKETYFSLNRDERFKGWSYLSIKFKNAVNYSVNYNKDQLDWLCFAFPKSTYEKCLDLDDVTCLLFNCTEADMKLLNLSYSNDNESKNLIRKGTLI